MSRIFGEIICLDRAKFAHILEYMNSFIYYNPTRLIFGAKTVDKLGDYIPKKARVLMLFGGGSAKKNGAYKAAKKMLGKRKSFEFWGIEPNPEYETCMKAVALIKKEKLDFILAVGGGSVIDAAKFIAAARFASKPWDILAKGAKIERALPIATILTLSATGSESNVNSVISRRKLTMKLAFASEKVYPVASVLDPEFQTSLPERQTVNGIVDSFIHVMEQYVTYPVDSPLQDGFAEAIMRTLVSEAPKILKNPDDISARKNIMLASTLALNGLIGCGVPQDWATHAIGHELTALYGIDHAQSLAIVAPKLLEVEIANKADKIAQMGRNVFGVSEKNKRAAAKAAIAAMKKFFAQVGIKTELSGYGIDKKSAAKAAAQNLVRIGHLPLGERGDIDAAKVEKILLK